MKSIPTIVAYAIASLGFLWFLIQVSRSYLERQVVSETRTELESLDTIPSVAMCWDPVITMSKYHFDEEPANFYNKEFLADFYKKRNNSTNLNKFNGNCQELMTTFDEFPTGNQKYICPFETYNASLEQQLAEPYRNLEEILSFLTLSYSTTDGTTEVNLTNFDYDHEIVYRDALRCYVIHFNLGQSIRVKSLMLSVSLQKIQGGTMRRFYVMPKRHIPRGNDKYIVDFSRLKIAGSSYNRVTINRLPYPFASHCREYSSQFQSRQHCAEDCLKAKMAASSLSTSLTYTSAEIANRTFEVTVSKMLYDCRDKCNQVDCQDIIYSTQESDVFYSLHLQTKPTFLVITQQPKTTLAVFIIYLGDLMASFFGFSFYTFGKTSCVRIIHGRWNFNHKKKTFCKRQRKMFKKISKRILSVACSIGFTYQLYTCITAYLQYETISATQLENKATHVLPKLSVCVVMPSYTLKKIKYDERATLGERLSVAPKFTDIIERMAIADGATGKSRLLEKPKDILADVSLSFFLFYAKFCYLVDLKQVYKTAERRLTKEAGLKLRFKGKYYAVFVRFQGNEIEDTYSSWYPERPLIHNMQYGRYKQILLPYPYSNCVDSGRHGFKTENSCRTQCLREQLPKNTLSYSFELFVKYIPLEAYNHTIQTSSLEAVELCKYKCDINFCLQDIITEKLSLEHPTPKHENYSMFLYGIPVESTFITMSPKTTLTDLIVYLSGIIGVWYGLNFSSISISLSTYISKLNVYLKPALIYCFHLAFLILFHIQMHDLIIKYMSYSTVMQVDIRYLSSVSPPRVSLCFEACVFLKKYHSFIHCKNRINNMTLPVLIENLNISRPMFEQFAIKNPVSLEWDYTPRHHIDNMVRSLPIYLKESHICFAYTPKKTAYDVDKIGSSGDLSWLKVKVSNDISRQFKLNLLNQNYEFDEAIVDNKCRPYTLGSNFISNRQIVYFWSTCEWWSYKTVLLPYPYDSNCRVYTISQSHCYRKCLNTILIIPKHKQNLDLYDMDSKEFQGYPDQHRLSSAKRHCVSICKQPDCEQYYSHLKSVDRLKVIETLENVARVYLTTKQYVTTLQPQMSFSEFVIYIATYLGVLLGIDALILNPMLKAVRDCLC